MSINKSNILEVYIMKSLKKIALVFSCMALLGAGSAFAADAARSSPLDEVQANPEVMRAPGTYITRGEIVAVEDGFYVIKGEGSRNMVAAIVDRDTYIVEGDSGKLRLPYALKVGQKVTAYYSATMTRSLPPQSHALAIVLEDSEESASFFEVAQASLAKDGSYVTVLNTNNDVIATIDAAACKDFAKIKKGDKLLVWSSMMTMSLPAQTHAEKVVVLP